MRLAGGGLTRRRTPAVMVAGGVLGACNLGAADPP